MTMKQTAPAGVNVETRMNSHCALQWPHNMGLSHHLARIIEGAAGASAVFGLLHADSSISDERGMSDNPETESVPLNNYYAHGLHMALKCCLNQIDQAADSMAKRETGGKS